MIVIASVDKFIDSPIVDGCCYFYCGEQAEENWIARFFFIDRLKQEFHTRILLIQ